MEVHTEAAPAQAALDRTRAFDRLAADIAASFLELPPEKVDEETESALGRVGKHTGTELVSLLTWVDAQKSDFVVSHEWRARAGPAEFRGTQVPTEFPWLAKQLARGVPLAINRLEDFPAAARNERERCRRIGIRAVVWVPFRTTKGLEGHICVNSMQRERLWSDDEIEQLRLVGQILAAALERKRADLELRDAYAELEELKNQLQQENKTLRLRVADGEDEGELIGRSHALERVRLQVRQVAPTDSTVLLLGETGTGKGLVARSIHEHSKRNEGPFVTVNCAALPESLLESELFGHEKGAFTGAVSDKIGRFETANGGTIFLDEIGEVPLHLQVKLLRFLQDFEFERVGSTRTRKADARVIAATNRDLDAMIQEETFRADLYFRIGVFPIHVPALRERREDIPLLVWYFVSSLQGRIGTSIDAISDREMNAFASYSWPGNVRELQNLVERAMILSSGKRLALDQVVPTGGSASGAPPTERLEDAERTHITRVLEECHWRIRGAGGAAERLGLKRTTLQSRMKKLGIERPGAGPAA